MLFKNNIVMITEFFLNNMFFKKLYHDTLGGGKRNFSDTHYTPSFTILQQQLTSCLSVCSASFFLQIKQKEG